MKEYIDRVHEGIPIGDVEIIDFHAHIGPHSNMHIPVNDPAGMVRLMDRCGIDKAVCSATSALTSDLVPGNSLMLDAVARHRGRIYGACAVNGNYPELSVDELERCFADSDVKCVKIHPFYSRCALDDRRMGGIYDFASKRELFAVVHTWLDNDPYGNLDLFERVAGDHPGINWLMGHSGGPYGGRRAVEISNRLPNVFLDLTLSMCPARQIEFFVREAGSRKVIFGTDNPFIDPRPQIGRVFLADITREEMIDIVGGNVRRYVPFERKQSSGTAR
jgi:uncharacterized protein